MDAQIQFVHIEHDKNLEELVHAHLDQLKSKYDWIIRAKVFLREEHDKANEGCFCEIELSVPGKNVFAKTHESGFEKAIAITIEELEQQLQKHKERMYGHKL